MLVHQTPYSSSGKFLHRFVVLTALLLAVPNYLFAQLTSAERYDGQECYQSEKTIPVMFLCGLASDNSCRKSEIPDSKREEFFCNCPPNQTGCKIKSVKIKPTGKIPAGSTIDLYLISGGGAIPPAPGACEVTLNGSEPFIGDNPGPFREGSPADNGTFRYGNTLPPPNCPPLSDFNGQKYIIINYSVVCATQCRPVQ